jgi:hypothetical protein
VVPSDVLNLIGWGFMPSKVTLPRLALRQFRVIV